MKQRLPSARLYGIVQLIVSLLTIFLTFSGPIPLSKPGAGDGLYFLLIAAHLTWALFLLVDRRPPGRRRLVHLFRIPELLIAFTLLLFLFAYIYATNANMGYVQRFIANGGNLRLALNTSTERAIALVRYLPFLAVDVTIYVLPRLQHPVLARRGCAITPRNTAGSGRRGPQLLATWGLLLVLIGAFLTAIAFPSFLRTRGIAILGWIGIVPLLLVLKSVSAGRGVFYGIVHGVFVTMITNYWLATFSLVSLQFAVTFFLVYYAAFMPVALLAYRLTPEKTTARMFVFPLAWTLFEYVRSVGFFGYPWALFAHSQVSFLPLIQVAALTGVWGVNFLVLLGNSAIAETLFAWISGRRRVILPAVVAGSIIGVALLAGGTALIVHPGPQRVVQTNRNDYLDPGSLTAKATADSGPTTADSGPTTADSGPTVSVRIALVQQNSDPRKNDYRDTLNTLERLTNAVLPEHPELVAWSETAFVPNIRRWSQLDPKSYDLAGIVHDFLTYQKSIDTWLLTGNDDYTLVTNPAGKEIDRLDYNASVLFNPDGERVQTYHKIKLVPFTEYFPYRKQLPGVYKLLQNFDVHFWVPGDSYTVFSIPGVKFSTPICFEDAFSYEVRKFVTAGAQLILNVSNDYWSLTDVEAQQHFVAGLFRSVENRRPLLRSTASGVTAYVDPYGRVVARLPFYEAASLTADVDLSQNGTTLYTLVGDWFPALCAIVLILMSMSRLVRFLGYAGNERRITPH